MRLAAIGLLTFGGTLFFEAPCSAQENEWNLRADFDADKFPSPWRYEGASPGQDDYFDLIPYPMKSLLPPDSVWRRAWVDPNGFRGTEYTRAFSIRMPGGTDNTPGDALRVHPEGERDPVISWTAPYDGTISVTGRAGQSECPQGSNGVRWRVLHGTSNVWTTDVNSGEFETFDLEIEVRSGDLLRFREDARGNSPCDWGFLATTIRYVSTTPKLRRGDVNQDGGFDIVDPIRTLHHLFSGEELLCRDGADVNDDGRLDVSDAIGGLGYLFLGTVAPAPPFAECGFDTTDDDLDCEVFAGCV